MGILSQNVDILYHSPQQRLLNRSFGLFFETYSACLALFLDNLNPEIFSKQKFYERKFQKVLISRGAGFASKRVFFAKIANFDPKFEKT